MKLSTFMLAFLVSTAIHIGALGTNLIHVNAGSLPNDKPRTVKLHIIPAAVRKPAPPLSEAFKENIEKSRTADSESRNGNKKEQLKKLQQDIPAAKNEKIVLREKQPVAVKRPSAELPVYREKSAPAEQVIFPSETIPDPLPKVTADSVEQFQEARVETDRPALPAVPGSGNDSCGDCSASLIAASSIVAARAVTGGGEIGPTIPAIITLSSKPTYPRYSRLHMEEGTTVLSVEILPDGQLGKVEVVRSSGHRRLDRAAVEGMQKAELVPALKNGRKVASVKRISIRFDLEDWGE